MMNIEVSLGLFLKGVRQAGEFFRFLFESVGAIADRIRLSEQAIGVIVLGTFGR